MNPDLPIPSTNVQFVEAKDGLIPNEFAEYTLLESAPPKTQIVKDEASCSLQSFEQAISEATLKTETEKKVSVKKEKGKTKRKKKESKKAAKAKKELICTCKKVPKAPKQIPWKDPPVNSAVPNTSQKILFKCSMCTFQTLTKEDIINHAEIHKNEVQIKKDSNEEPCKKCTAKKKNQLIKQNKCPHCNFFTTNERSLKIHMHIHANKHYKCINCGYAATDVKELIRHQQIHIDEKKCRTCKSVFYYREKPRKNKQLMCKTCFYPATSKTDLQLHQKSHKQIKPCSLPVPNSDYDTIVE